MKTFKVVHLILFTGLYFFFSIAVSFMITFEGLSVWMGINVAFAMIPLIIIVFLYDQYKETTFKTNILLVIGIIIFILFYPNSFYILTDFMHLDSIDFYSVETMNGYLGASTTNYRLIIDPYFLLFHIILSALIGAYAGIQSLLYVEKIIFIKYQNKRLVHIVTITLLFLSSLGIYLGRFLRFFSFDILRPIYLLKTFFASIDLFTFSFVFFFTCFTALLFYGYKYFVIQKPNE